MDNWKRIMLRAAGFGGGFAVIVVVTLGIVLWWSERPTKPRPWDTQAITPAGKNELEVQTKGEVFHLQPKCNLRNNTDRDYRITTESGTLMVVNPDNGGLEKLDDATWDRIVIPARQIVNVKIDITYYL